LGSNSFHLLVARWQHGQLVTLDRRKETVRLAADLDDNSILSEDGTARALACLDRFGEILREMPHESVRVVGTNAMRRMKQGEAFRDAAESALGHPVEIIGGREEARLIYLGVSHSLERGEDRRLVIDIGGGSTEVIVGKGPQALHRESLEVGCVVLNKRFFFDGVVDASRFREAELYAELAIQPVVALLRSEGWEHVIGCSGSVRAIATVLQNSGWARGAVSLEGLEKLRSKIIAAGTLNRLELSGLDEDRRPVFAGGLAVMHALMKSLDLKVVEVSDMALREGVIFDLLGRDGETDARVNSIKAMIDRWRVDEVHARNVLSTAIELYRQIASNWDIHSMYWRDGLTWGAQIHEIGLQISHDSYHKHGAYVVANADLAGFARRDQALLSALVAGHRRKFALDSLEALPATMVTPAKRVSVLLRLAVLFNRSRKGTDIPNVLIQVDGPTIQLKLPKGWLDEHPLTEGDLVLEKSALKAAGFKLKYG
jgi:exopolyphosphatase / guanosine-5'-triphosphate,3'-diphosphate pyrophosphatase